MVDEQEVTRSSGPDEEEGVKNERGARTAPQVARPDAGGGQAAAARVHPMAKIMRRKVTLRIWVTEGEIMAYLVKNREKLETGLSYHARHILISPRDATATPAGRRPGSRPSSCAPRLREGADFAELATAALAVMPPRRTAATSGHSSGASSPRTSRRRSWPWSPGRSPRPSARPWAITSSGWSRRRPSEGGLTRTRQQIRDILFRQKYEARLRRLAEGDQAARHHRGPAVKNVDKPRSGVGGCAP